MRRTVQHPRWSGRQIVLAALALIAVAVVALTMRGAPAQPANPPSAPAPVPHFLDLHQAGEIRTVVIGGASDRLPGTSNTSGYLMANLRAGQIPAGATGATVLSDANCEPDADGVSHCLNDLDIGGVVITVQHHHKMSEVACLTPGEAVALMPLAQYQQQ